MKPFYLFFSLLLLAGISLKSQNTNPVPDSIGTSYNTLDINNIKAGINANGYLFNNYKFADSAQNNNFEYKPAFEAPVGSGINAVFCGSLWIGGNDNVNTDWTLHMAAVRYMQIGNDFWSGPVSSNYDFNYDLKWSKVWKLTLNDIKYHINHYQDFGYIPKNEIATWPGNGDVSNGEAAQLAPYFDKNNNGIYEPMQGDYPLIRGNQAVYFIFNDDRDFHTESKGKSLGIEIHGMAYAFNDEADSALWNTVFVHYDIYNRSDTTYYNTYIGNFTDTDLGNPFDDYVRCNVKLGAMIAYNGDDFDEDEQTNEMFYKGYGDNLAALGTVMLGGAFMDADNIDNPSGGCDESINGLNFGNGIADDERWGMQYFGYMNNIGAPHTDPMFAPEYYNVLQGNFMQGTPWYLINNNDDSISFNYWFPGNSDSCHYGTGGVDPGFNWTEENDNGGTPNPPGDRRGFLSTGPFTFKPGDVQQLDMAYVFARSYDTTNVLDIVANRIAAVRNDVILDSLIALPDEIDAVNKNKLPQPINIWPNPAHNGINIDCRSLQGSIRYAIYSVTGTEVNRGLLRGNALNHLQLDNLKNGLYLIRLQTGNGFYYGKFIKQ